MRRSDSAKGALDEIALHADAGFGCSGNDRVVLGISEADLDGTRATTFDTMASRCAI